MDSWLSHTLTGLGAFAVGVAPIVRQWRKDGLDAGGGVMAMMQRRIDTLEERVEKLHAENVAYLQSLAAANSQIAGLQQENAALRRGVAAAEAESDRREQEVHALRDRFTPAVYRLQFIEEYIRQRHPEVTIPEYRDADDKAPRPDAA